MLWWILRGVDWSSVTGLTRQTYTALTNTATKLQQFRGAAPQNIHKVYAKFKFSKRQPQIQRFTGWLSRREFQKGIRPVIDTTAGVWGFSAGSGPAVGTENITDPESSKSEHFTKSRTTPSIHTQQDWNLKHKWLCFCWWPEQSCWIRVAWP